MIPCTARETCGAWLITFANGRTLLLTTENDRASFAVARGVLHASGDWDGRSESLDGWETFDPTEIEQCLDEYADLAE